MRKFVFLFILSCYCLVSNAQFDTKSINDKLYDVRVKLVDEFFARFNLTELRADIKEDKDFQSKNLLLLFDGKMFKNFEDEKYKSAKELVDTVLSKNIQISYEDTTWFAKAKCHGKFKNQDVDFILYLNVEHRKADMFKWVISRAEGEIFRLVPAMRSEKIMITPGDHEINFISLHRITTERDENIINYSQKEFPLDETSVFYSYVYNGLLDIDYVSELEFFFYQVPGYEFIVKHIERNNYNTGWLISSFRKISDGDKSNIINHLYYKH